MSNVTDRNLPNGRLLQGTYTTTNALIPSIQSWPRMTTVAENTLVESILADAVWRIDALDHQNEGAPAKIVRNLGSAGPILNCTSGSTSIADTNDPKFLDWYSTNYVYLPGVASNNMSVPDANDLDITGDIDIRVRVALDDWTPSANSGFISKGGAVGNRSWNFTILTTGGFRFTWFTDGTNNITKDSTATVTLSDGEVKWARVTFDVDNGASGNDVKFYTSDDGTNWTQLGNTITTAGVTNIYASTATVNIGNISGGGSPTAGKFYRAQILDGIDGTTVLDIDTSVITSGGATSFTAGTGQTVTINRSTTGRKTVAVTTPCWLFGTDDQILVPNSTTGSKAVDFGPNDSFTLLVVMRQWNTNSTFRGILSKYTGPGALTGPGYIILTSNPSNLLGVTVEDITDSGFARSYTFTNGNVSLFAGIVNRNTNTLQSTNSSGIVGQAGGLSSISSLGNIINRGQLTVGARGAGNNHVDIEFIAAGIWRRALSQDEVTAIRTYYLDRWK